MSWFQIWTVCWQVAMFVTPVILALCVLWLRSQFPTKGEMAAQYGAIVARADTDRSAVATDIKTLDRQAADHGSRLNAIEKDLAKPPTRHTLNNELAKLQAGVHSVGKSLDAVKHQVETQAADTRRSVDTLNGYLHTLIEKHLGS